MSTNVFPYLVDPFRVGQVYASGDLELERAVFAAPSWPPTHGRTTADDADQALDAIINGGTLVASRRALYTLVLEQICGVLGTPANVSCPHEDPALLAGDLIHYVNEALRRLGTPELRPIEYPQHPFLPGLELTVGDPTVEVYPAMDCKRTRLVLKARWSELTTDEKTVAAPLLHLFEHRRLHDLLVLFSY